jgi:UDPglucose 6-dehydrogenase
LVSVDVLWITYDTPVDENDVPDPDFVLHRIRDIVRFLKNSAVVLISSQLPVGTTRKLERSFKTLYPDKEISLAYLPENLRLGKAIDSFMRPDRIIVGIHKESDRPVIKGILEKFSDHIEWMSIESAEMTKHALNAFLATSVAFINELANLCREVGANPYEVEQGLKSDGRIGTKAYLHPGNPFSGGTLARDIHYLAEIGREHRIPTHLLSGVLSSNDYHKNWPKLILSNMYGALIDRKIALLGLTYKPGTDTLRRSSALEIGLWLQNQGSIVTAYDPVVGELPNVFSGKILLCKTLEEALRDVDAAIVSTEWPVFRELNSEVFLRTMKSPTVIDVGGFLGKTIGKDARIRFITIGNM